MATYSRPRILGRVIVLLLLLIVMMLGAVAWLDYLAVIDAKNIFAPVYSLLGLSPRSSRTLPPDASLSLDGERLGARLEALELRSLELDRSEQALTRRQQEIEQMAQELEERQKAIEEKENSFNQRVEQFENRRVNVEQNARYLSGMPPEKAVAIIVAMDDQDVIDVFRMTEEIAKREGTASLVAYWLSLMPPERSAELQRKMAGKPHALN